MNDVTINYKKLRKLFPKKVKKGNERGYTIEEIRKIVNNTKSKRNKALVLLFASSGVRLGAIPDILLKHLTKIGKNSYAIKIYEDETEEDYIFTTPEATKAIDEYLDERKKDGEYVDQDSPLIRTSYKLGIEKAKSCNLDTLAHLMGRIVSCVDRKKRGNRYDVPKDHGFRKFYGTVIKDTQGITATMSEKLINHIGVVQLDGSYFKPTKEQMFESYRKVIPGLTIDQTEKHEALIESQKKKITELSKKDRALDEETARLVKDAMKEYPEIERMIKEEVKKASNVFQKQIDEIGGKIDKKLGLTEEDREELEIEKKRILQEIEERKNSDS